MPIQPRPYCSHRNPPCSNKAGTRSSRCVDHELEYQRSVDAKRPSSYARGATNEWRAFASMYLRANPRCMCDVCKALPYWQRDIATDVDHIDGTGRNGPRAYDLTNLRAMSHSHHSQRTARDQPGGWHKARRGQS